MKMIVDIYGKDSPMMRGYLSAMDDPLFSGKRVDFFDAVIKGHVHSKIYEKGSNTDFYSIRAAGMAYAHDPIDTSSYIILKEKENSQGFDLEEVSVKYDSEKMTYSILTSGNLDRSIIKFTNLDR